MKEKKTQQRSQPAAGTDVFARLIINSAQKANSKANHVKGREKRKREREGRKEGECENNGHNGNRIRNQQQDAKSRVH